MGLITEEVEVGLGGSNVKHLESLGYKIPREKNNQGRMRIPQGTKIIVKVKDLTDKSNALVDIQCDNSDCNKIINNVSLYDFRRYLKEGKYYCHTCAMKFYGHENYRLARLKNGKSLEQWCTNNNRQDVIDLWDYELNDCNPSEINYGTVKKYYFKCPRGLHPSELKNINSITNKNEMIACNKCNSFAQRGIDDFGDNFLEKYWDYDNVVDPWEISYGSNKKVLIICQIKDYHESYSISCSHFTDGKRCSYCAKTKVHPLDSLGKILEDKNLLSIWSIGNNKSPYLYAPNSHKRFLWVCSEGKHNDYYRSAYESNDADFRCPECQYSKGEGVINNYLRDDDWIKIAQDDYDKLFDVDKYSNTYFIPQKTFDGLVGLGGGLLSYDFYLPQYNLLIEYQGEQHERYIKYFHKSIEDFEKQVEHDRRKKEYAQQNGYNFLEIWYWDFDNIEEILTKELNIIKNLNISN